MNLVLVDEHATRLRLLEELVHVSPGIFARLLLSQALDYAEQTSSNIAALLDFIDGTFERAEVRSADIAAARYVDIEDIGRWLTRSLLRPRQHN